MSLAYKVLGQNSPSATTNTTLYTCPAQKQAVVSSIVVVNRNASAGTFRIAIRPDGETIANKHYIAFDETLNGNTRIALTLGVTIDAGDIVTIYASSTDFSFNAFGVEIQ